MGLNSLLFSLLPIAMVLPAYCQDLVKVAPNAAKVEYEDERIRVVRLRLAPNEKLPMHDRPSRVVITLTANDVVLTRADGTTSTTRTPAGQIAWSGPGKRAVTNGPAALENVVIELKHADEPAQPVTHAPAPGPKVLTDKFHPWAFENQYVRVYNVSIPPGETTEFHTHAFDSVFVQLSGGVTMAQKHGEDWGVEEKAAKGEVEYSPDAKNPRVHRVRNPGPSDYRVAVVQLMK